MSDDEVTKPGNKRPPPPLRRHLAPVPNPVVQFDRERAEKEGAREFASIVGKMFDEKLDQMRERESLRDDRITAVSKLASEGAHELRLLFRMTCAALVLSALSFGGFLSTVYWLMTSK